MRPFLLAAVLVLAAGPALAQDTHCDFDESRSCTFGAYGSATLAEGFGPDPYSFTFPIGEGAPGLECDDIDSALPLFELTYDAPFEESDLYVSAFSSVGVVLLVGIPDGRACDEGSFGEDFPLIHIPNAPSGLYTIRVVSQDGSSPLGQVSITDFDPRR